MPGFAFSLLGPIALISSHYHRKYIWHYDNPALNPYHYTHDQIVPNSTEAVMTPIFNATRNATIIGMPPVEIPKPWYIDWLFPIAAVLLVTLVLGALDAYSAYQSAYQSLKKSKATMFDACVATGTAETLNKLRYQKGSELLMAQLDHVQEYWLGRSDSWDTKSDELKEEVQKLKEENDRKDREHDEAMGRKDRDHDEEMGRKDREHEDQNNQKDRDHDEEMGQKDREHDEEMDRKDREHEDQNNQKDRDHADEIGRMKEQLRDSEQRRDNAEQSGSEYQKKIEGIEKSHKADIDAKVQALEAEYQLKTSDLIKDHKTEIDGYERKISELMSDHEGNLEDLKKDLKAVAVAKEADMKADYEADLAAKLSKKDKAHEAEVAKINQERINTLNKNTKNLNNEHDAEVSKLKRNNEAESKQAKREHEKAMDSLRDSKDSEIARITSESQADKDRTVKAHQDAMAEVRRGHKAAQASNSQAESEQAKRDHEKALNDLKESKDSEIAKIKSEGQADKEAQMQAHESSLEAQASDFRGQISDLEARHSEEMSDARKSYAERFEAQLSQETELLNEEIADLKAALGPAKGKARASSQEPLDDGQSAEDLLGGDGSDNELDVSKKGDNSSVKKRRRKQRGPMNRAKLPNALSPEDRLIYLQQTAMNKSENGRIGFGGIDWAALAEGLTNYNGANIQWLVDEAKIIADKDGRWTVVTQRDFEDAIPKIDDIGGIQTAEAAASSAAGPLSWDNRRSLFQNFRSKNFRRSKDVDFEAVTQMTIGFNGAEVQRVVNVAIKEQTHEGIITRADLERAILEHKAGLAKYQNKNPAWENDVYGPTPPQPLPPRPRPPPFDGSIRDGHAPYTPPHRLLPRPPPNDGSVRPGYGVYIPPRFPWP